MEPISDRSSQRSGAGKVIGGLVALYVLVCLCIGVYGYFFRQQIPGVQGYFPTATATADPTPMAHPPQPLSGDKILKEDFSNNNNVWTGEDNPPSDAQIKNGKLTLASLKPGSFGYAYCQVCPILASPFYIQVDFSTNQLIDESYGIAFSSDKYHTIFYIFQINAKKSRYDLYKYGGHGFSLRTSRNTTLIKPYPNTNTLSVSLKNDLIVMYINGEMVDTYQDTGSALGSGVYWPFVNNSGFTLYVDNLLAYGR